MSEFPIRKAAQHLVRMPLDKMAGTGGDFFSLDRKDDRFTIREQFREYWLDPHFREQKAQSCEDSTFCELCEF